MKCFTLEYIRTHKVRQVRIERACGLLAAALAFLLIRALGVTCLIKYFTGIACPTCGMSGAVLCLLNGDFEGYISSNVFALPVGAIICSLVFPELWKKRAYIAVVGVVLAANMAYYIARMVMGAL